MHGLRRHPERATPRRIPWWLRAAAIAPCALLPALGAGAPASADPEPASIVIDAPDGPAPGLPASLTDLAERLRRCVVVLSATSKYDARETLYGTGFVVSARGYIVTTDDMLSLGRDLRAALPGGYDVPVDLVNRDPNTNLALLEIPEGVAIPPLVPAALGDSDRVRVGEWVVTLGQSDAETPSLAKGVVAGKQRNGGPRGISGRLLQLDIPLLPTFTGAPVADMAGRVIGIVTGERMRRQDDVLPLSFALPINEARSALFELVQRRARPRAWLGVVISRTEAQRGARIEQVFDGSPAAGARLRTGDVIVEFEGKRVRAPEDLEAHVAETAPGDRVEVIVERAGARTAVRAEIARLPEPSRDRRSDPELRAAVLNAWGFAYEELDADLRARFSLSPEARGFVVSAIERRSPAWRADLRLGDVLLEVDRHPVRDAADLTRALRQRSLVLRVARGDTARFVALQR